MKIYYTELSHELVLGVLPISVFREWIKHDFGWYPHEWNDVFIKVPLSPSLQNPSGADTWEPGVELYGDNTVNGAFKDLN